jgi:hypothetical protein
MPYTRFVEHGGRQAVVGASREVVLTSAYQDTVRQVE